MPRRPFVALVLAAALSVSFGAFAPSQAAAAEPTPLAANVTTDLAARVQAFYDKSQTFTAHFDQEFTVKAYNTKRSSAGTVYFQKPGKMAWVYSTPEGNRVVSNGTTVRVYEAANKQMFEQQVSGGQSGAQYPAALSFLLGRGKLSDAFNFEGFEGSQMKFEGGTVLVGTPKTPTPAYTKVLFYVDTQSAQIRRVLILDAQGNRNSFVFSQVQVNTAVPGTTFVFEPPAGTTVVRP
jgi:outer membrane lipoprotein carrier protein